MRLAKIFGFFRQNSYLCIRFMARKLSKKKISGWLLLFAVIAFIQCDGHKKTVSMIKELFSETTQITKKKAEKKDIPVDARLTERLDSFVSKTNRVGSLGVFVWDETAHKPVYAFNPDTLMRPASNMKMLTCITALRRLGPHYHYESGSYYSGELKGDTLFGNIAFKFTFDPWINSESVMTLASALSQKGIRFVKGKVVLDAAIKEQMLHEEHWTIGDLRLRNIGMLYRGENRIANEMKYALRANGVNFLDKNFVTEPISKGMKQAGRISTPIHYSIFRALQNSSNEHAESLGYPLSLPYLTDQDYREAAARYLRHFIEVELGYNPDDVCRIHDTSGLCVHDRLSPRFLVSLLRYAHSHKYIWDTLQHDLPISGMTGTLHDRMLRPAVRGKIHAKTGTLTREDGITSLSGYTTSPNGHLLFFSIIQNEYPVYDARLWQDRFCTELVK